MADHMPSIETDAAQRWRDWRDAARRAAVDTDLRRVYQHLADAIAERRPTCWLSGACCKFDTYGHRLYVTALEVAWLIDQLDAAARQRLAGAALPRLDGCPFQAEKLCTVHDVRPLGCRIFFCDASAQSWQGEVYEAALNDLRLLHERHDIEYAYMEWRAALDEARAVLLR